MLIVMRKNGSVQLLAARPFATPSALPPPEERERRYAVIARRLEEECGLVRAPVVKSEKN